MIISKYPGECKMMTSITSRCGLRCDVCSFRESCNCGGCIATAGVPFHGECIVAKCCQSRGYLHCGECPELPCRQLYAYSCEDKEHGDNPPGARIEQCRRWALQGILRKFAQSDWKSIAAPAQAYLDGHSSPETLIKALSQADHEDGFCSSEFDVLYRKALGFLKK